MRRFRPGWWLSCLLLAALCVAWGEQRFPPPEFETGYRLPITQTPAPRSLAWQYADAGLLVVALGLGSYLVLKRRSRRGVVLLSLFSVVYFGFIREGCICPIGAPQNVMLALCNPAYALPLTVLVLFLAPLVVSLFAGRVFCAAVCPHGALQDLVLLRPVKVPGWLEQGLGVLPYAFLGAGLLFAGAGSGFVICRYDPFVPLFRMSGSTLMLWVGGIFLVLAMFIGRPYCRFLCPYGALLRLTALASRWRVRITPDYCTQCRLCEESCPFGAIREPVPAPTGHAALAPDRRRLGQVLLALPILIVGGGWLGSKLEVPLSRIHPEVVLAERIADPKRSPSTPTVADPDSLALGRADQDPKAIVATATEVRRRFHLGGWLFGCWIGLVIGVRLASLTVRPARTDFEPDRGACVACARCFLSCPNERVRLGLMSADDLPRGPVPAPVPVSPTARANAAGSNA